MITVERTGQADTMGCLVLSILPAFVCAKPEMEATNATVNMINFFMILFLIVKDFFK